MGRFLPAGKGTADAYRLASRKWIQYYRGLYSYDQEDLSLVSDMYDAGLAYLSRVVGDLLEIVHDRGLDENILVVITSDHGELFGESGRFGDTGLLGHMFGLYNGTVHVLLMI
jgi:arylsulfatase A-like enzyme